MAATERIIIQVNERGSRTVARNLRKLGVRAQSSSNDVNLLKRALGGIGAALITRNFIRIADSVTQMENRLRIVTSSVGNLNSVFDELVEASIRSRTTLESNIELFARVALSIRDMGVAQKEIIQFTESVNKAIIVSGANAREANAGLIQFAQGLASGALRGDELRSVLEQLPFVADIIAKEFNLTRGELRKFAETGQLVTSRILKAFRTQREEIELMFRKTIPTLAQAYVQLGTRVTVFIRNFDDSVGISDKLRGVLDLVRVNIDTVGNSLIKLGIILIGALLSPAVFGGLAKLGAALKALVVFGVANPFMFTLIGVGAAIGALVAFRREIKFTADGVVDLGDVGKTVFDAVDSQVRDIFEGLAETIGTALETSFKEFSFFEGDVLESLARLESGFIGLAIGALESFKIISDALDKIVTRSSEKVFVLTGGSVPRIDLSTITEAFKKFLSVNTFFFPVEIKIDKAQVGTLEDAIIALKAAKALGLGGLIGKDIEGAFRATAAERAAERARRGQERLGLDEEAASATQLKIDKAAQKVLNKVIDSTFGAIKANREFAESQAVIRGSVDQGRLSLLEGAAAMKALSEATRDARDPVGAITRELQAEREILNLNTREQEVAIETRDRLSELFKKQGFVLKETIPLIEEEVRLTQESARAAQERNRLFDEFVAPAEASTLALRALIEAEKDGTLQGEALRRATAAVRREALLLENTFRSGLSLAVLDLGDSFSQVAFQVADTFTLVFSELENIITDFIIKGEASFRQFALTILNEITRILVRMAILQPLLGGFQNLFNFGGGAVAPAVTTIIPGAASGAPSVAGVTPIGSFISDKGGFSPAPAATGGNTSIFQLGGVEVNITGGGGGSSEDNEELATEIGKAVREEFRGFVLDIIRKESRSGGALNRQSNL